MCKPGFWKSSYWERLWKRPYLERLCGYACKRCSAQKPVDQVLDIRSDGANRWQTQQKTETTIEMTARCAKPSWCWRRRGQSPQRKERSRRNKEELGAWVQVRRGKNQRQGESLNKTKTKQTVQLWTNKIHKTRRQASGFLKPRHWKDDKNWI